MSRVFLYRVKFVRGVIVSLFDEGISPSDLFLLSLREIEGKSSPEKDWVIGGLEFYSELSGKFSIGKHMISELDNFDSDEKVFKRNSVDDYPNTLCFFDAELGLLGITSKFQLSSDTGVIARKIGSIVGSSLEVTRRNIFVEVEPIRDPEGLVDKIRKCYKVKSFSASFTRPNPYDADKYFQKPLSVYCQSINGIKGTAKISGDDLDKDVLIEVTRSTVSTGNRVSAKIIQNMGEKPISISTENSATGLTIDYENETGDNVVSEIRSAYQVLREGD